MMKIEQEIVEEMYSRKNIHAVILKDIDCGSDSLLWPMAEAIAEYRAKIYYDSKNTRIQQLSPFNNLDLAIEMHIVILPLEGIVPIQQAVALLSNYLDFDDQLEGLKTASELIAVCSNVGLYSLHHRATTTNHTDTLAIESHYTLSTTALEFIERTSFLPPMLCIPRDWDSTSYRGGYLTATDSVILGRLNQHDYWIDTCAINQLQQVSFSINEEMLEQEELPTKPLKEKALKQFYLHVKQSRDTCNKLINAGNKFYFVHKKDFRGRIYSLGYHVNLQGTKYKRSLLEFSDKQLITD
jgi:hypothetical protein